MLHGFHGSIRRTGHNMKAVVGELRPYKDETMDSFRQDCKKFLWYAYDRLDTGKTGTVNVSQLKVLTSSIGMTMGFEKAEEILSKITETSMDFNTYFDIVNSELIVKQEHSDETCFGQRLNDIIKTCWSLCSFPRAHKSLSVTSDHCLLLWRLFNTLNELDADGLPEVPVRLDAEEAAILFSDFIDNTGQRNKESIVTQFLDENKDAALMFTDFLNMFEKEFVPGLSNKAVTQGLHQLYDKYVLNILDKGMVWKRGYKVRSWKERWMVLTTTELNYFVNSDEKIQKGSITFDEDCSIEVPADRPTHRPNRFVLNTSKKPYDMSASDVKTKNEWISAIQTSLSRIGKDPNIQKEAAAKRCAARKEKRRLAEEEGQKRQEEAALLLQRQNELDEANKKRLEDEELLKARLSELEEERKRREEAEAKWLEEETLRKAEQERLRQLEEIKLELERLLAEERQAKKDEEIVRSLQAKLLEEEFEKREELERLKHQQEEMLKAEREQKAVIESDRLEQERRLAEAQARLDQLEQERVAATEKMQEATEKLQRAEKDRCILEEKVKLWRKPVGLARPLPPPQSNPHVTHRGLGAFCDKDFVKPSANTDQRPKSPQLVKSEEKSCINNIEPVDETTTETEDIVPGEKLEENVEGEIISDLDDDVSQNNDLINSEENVDENKEVERNESDTNVKDYELSDNTDEDNEELNIKPVDKCTDIADKVKIVNSDDDVNEDETIDTDRDLENNGNLAQ
ncbi:Differentially expressed in FDCP 6 [Mactra antiquata]